MKRRRATAGPRATISVWLPRGALRRQPHPTKPSPLTVLHDLMLGGRHSRNTVARMGVSLPTADRWLKALERAIPGVRRVKLGQTAWLEWTAPVARAKHVDGLGETR